MVTKKLWLIPFSMLIVVLVFTYFTYREVSDSNKRNLDKINFSITKIEPQLIKVGYSYNPHIQYEAKDGYIVTLSNGSRWQVLRKETYCFVCGEYVPRIGDKLSIKQVIIPLIFWPMPNFKI